MSAAGKKLTCIPNDGTWFSELGELWPGQAMSLEVESVLFDENSKFQHVQVFKSKNYGTVLVLDGVIQITERDEHAYQEMITHLPMNSHPDPKKVLVVGGGDGGVLREVLRYNSVEELVICEIDEMVIDVSKKYLPDISQGAFDDPKVTVFCGDGAEYMRKHQDHFDVIITDSSDPIGPAATLFEKNYYSLMRSALKEDGILATQGECMWLHLDLIKGMLDFCRELFPQVAYGYTCIPTYPSGQIGFVLCSKNASTTFETPLMPIASRIKECSLKYYNEGIHKAAFVLPEFARKKLEAN
eukprot:m.337486 g.337486  ORF g.337486 m.337486 type:complete len:299 (-) comp18146_c0_seq1:1527-2423(-)